MKCPYCDSIVKKAKFCSECGKELETGLSKEQKEYLTKNESGHKIEAITGRIVGGDGAGLGAIGVIGGIILLILGILLSLTGIGAIIGIPMVIIGIIVLVIVGKVATAGAAMSSAKKSEEIGDRLHGVGK